MANKTVTIVISSVKDPDMWAEVIRELDLSDKQRERFFSFSEYASLELTINQDLHFTGRILPK